MYCHLVFASVLFALCQGSQNYAAPPLPVDSKQVISPYTYQVLTDTRIPTTKFKRLNLLVFQIQPSYLPQPRCHYVNETECVTETKRECQPETKEVCLEVNESVCEEVEEEACTEVATQRCEEEEKTACTNFVTQECKEEPGEPREEEVCQDAVIEECVGFEIQTCEVAVEDDCRNVTTTVCSPSTRSVLDLEISRWGSHHGNTGLFLSHRDVDIVPIMRQ